MNTHSPQRDANSPPGHLVVLGSGPRADWEQALRRLAADGPLLLIDQAEPTWQRSHLVAARTANLLNAPQVLQVAQRFAIAYPIAGVINFNPAHLRAAALVRQELGLPGPAAGTLEATALRHRTAELLDLAGIESSASQHADSFDQALEAAHHVGFPLICKPASPKRRYAARIVGALPELAEAFAAATAATWPETGTVIEPLLEGIEATAYTYAKGSGTRVIAVSHTTFDPQAEPALLPVEVVVDADDVCAAAIEDIARRALTAIGHHQGPAQIRLRITATGPRVISISTHVTDPLVAQLIEQVTGVDLIAASGAHARGRTPHIEYAPLGAAAVRYIQATGTTAPSTSPQTHPHITPFTDLHTYEPEGRIGPLRRSGHLLVTGTDYPQVIARLRSAVAQLHTTRLSA
ncbi:ATP-grasp domain-containing protein [Streptomyces sp. 7N604]|uniref:ATP-grasp domain-containing protein n=1 Tax=Streptomyces sp. 7N604 TaxID=3457415 RepID=UPI003FD109E7